MGSGGDGTGLASGGPGARLRGRLRPGGCRPLPASRAILALATRPGPTVVRVRSTGRAAGPARRLDSAMIASGRDLRITSLDKVLWPETGFTKGDLIDWYSATESLLLPHLARHPIMLGRWPEGVAGRGFSNRKCTAGCAVGRACGE